VWRRGDSCLAPGRVDRRIRRLGHTSISYAVWRV
jgi:hypothetical protein